MSRGHHRESVKTREPPRPWKHRRIGMILTPCRHRFGARAPPAEPPRQAQVLKRTKGDGSALELGRALSIVRDLRTAFALFFKARGGPQTIRQTDAETGQLPRFRTARRVGRGEVAEWFKAHAWNACIRETVSRVRIPLSPPFCFFQPHNVDTGAPETGAARKVEWVRRQACSAMTVRKAGP